MLLICHAAWADTEKGKLYFDIGSIDRSSDTGLVPQNRDDASARCRRDRYLSVMSATISGACLV